MSNHGSSPPGRQTRPVIPIPTSPPDSNIARRGSSQSLGRRRSISLLHRQKSTELRERTSSGSPPSSGSGIGIGISSIGSSRAMRRAQKEAQDTLRRQAVSTNAPKLPDLPTTSIAAPLGLDTGLPPSPPKSPLDEKTDKNKDGFIRQGLTPDFDPYARTESMTHRGRYSYASSAVSTVNSPRRVRRRKDPTPYNVLVVGAKNSGKTSFLEFLRQSLALPPQKRPIKTPEEIGDEMQRSPADANFASHYLETEIDGERVGVTLWDSHGLEPNIVDLQLKEITDFLEAKFEDTFAEETKVIRSPGVRDTHIHCAFLVLDPSRLDMSLATGEKTKGGKSKIIGCLGKEMDVHVMQSMKTKTTVIPIISKADTVTTAHMAFLKKSVRDSLKMAGLNPLEALTLDDSDSESDQLDEEDEVEAQDRDDSNGDGEKTQPSGGEADKADKSTPADESAPADDSRTNAYVPPSVISPDPHSFTDGGPIGRCFPWGFADPLNPEHCDFGHVKSTVFHDWRAELRVTSREVWYEQWRTERLNTHGVGMKGSVNGNGMGLGARRYRLR